MFMLSVTGAGLCGCSIVQSTPQDGRVVFMLPWLEATIAGTTDSSAEITMRPQPSEEEIRFILDSIAEYLTVKVRSLAFMPRVAWCPERLQSIHVLVMGSL